MTTTTVYVVTELWEGDGMSGTPLAVYRDRDQANAHCRQHVADHATDWDLPLLDETQNGLAHFEADAPYSHRRSSAMVTRLELL